MSYTLEQFAAECHIILKADSGPSGRQKLCELLQQVLKDEEFVAKYLPDNAPERQVLYQDPELGFCIVAHVYQGPKDSPPHDHGHSWAIYGQARGETRMTDWKVMEPATESKPGKVRPEQSYTLIPGMTQLYNEGELHAPSRSGPTRLIRIEGENMDKVGRFKYEPM